MLRLPRSAYSDARRLLVHGSIADALAHEEEAEVDEPPLV
jgi:hypothetical protein